MTLKQLCAGLLSGILFTCFAVTGSAQTAAQEKPVPEQLKILAIGNSFSVDGMEYLWDIANAGGVKEVVLGNLYIGGCSLETHAKHIAAGNAAYTYYKNTNGTWVSTASTSVQTAIADEEWDIITVQQASQYSGMASTYSSLSSILDFLATAAPNADVYFHMTWAYQANSTHSGFANYDKDQMTMYNAILGAVDEVIKPEEAILGIIPSGTAIQNLRTSYIGDTVTRDGYHLSHSHGRYTAALTWYAFFTGASVDTIDWVPADHATLKQDLPAIREAVTNAIATPFAVTPVTAEEPHVATDAELIAMLGHNINSYKTVDWALKLHAYYKSDSSFNLVDSTNSTASNLKNYIASYQFTKEELPVGSIIIVDEGYQYRPEGWVGANTTTAKRPSATSTRAVEATEAWWGDYTHRAFNFSASPAHTMTANESVHMRIYVPKYPDVTFTDSADINGDGTVNLQDALLTLKTVVNKDGAFFDLNNDGVPSLLDIVALLKSIVA